MRLILLTSGRVNYIFSSCSLYESIRLTAEGKRFPHICSPVEVESFAEKIKLSKNSVILTAPSNQARETAQILGKSFGKNIIVDKRLLPLRFDLGKILSESEFLRLGDGAFDVLRSRYIDAFFENELIDKQADFKKKYKGFMCDMSSLYFDKTVIAVSHSYLIQSFYIYGKIGDRKFEDRDLFRKLFNPSKPLGFLKTIELEIGYN